MKEKTAAEICEEWMATRFELWRYYIGEQMRERHWWQSRFLDDLPKKWTPARQEAQNIIWREYIAPKLGIKLEPWQLDLLKSQYR